MIRRITSSYDDISLLVSRILMPHVFPMLDARYQSFIGLLSLVDGVRVGNVVAFAAFNDKAELVGASWGWRENDEFQVHSAFNRHINTEPYIAEMMNAVDAIQPVENFTAYVPETYRYVVVGLGMQGWTNTGVSAGHDFIDKNDTVQPCVRLVKRLQHA